MTVPAPALQPPAPWATQGPTAPGSAGRGAAVPLLAGLTVLLLVLAGGALYLGRSDDARTAATAPVGSAATAAPPAGTGQPSAAPAPQEPTGPTGSTSDVTTPVSTGASGSPSSTPFQVVVVASKTEADGGRPAAEALLPAIRNAGYPAIVFPSENYSSLRCCYWVAAAGPFSSASAAKTASADLRSRSSVFSIAYARCVGLSDECP